MEFVAGQPAILDWAIGGLVEWRQQGLNPPSRVLQSRKTYRDDNDTIGHSIEAACILEPRVQATMIELYESYKSWCENSAAEPLQNNSFGKELTRRGFESFRWRSGNGRTGIALKPPAVVNLKVAQRQRRGMRRIRYRHGPITITTRRITMEKHSRTSTPFENRPRPNIERNAELQTDIREVEREQERVEEKGESTAA
jgi:phage/plasmid-associated DNA primase